MGLFAVLSVCITLIAGELPANTVHNANFARQEICMHKLLCIHSQDRLIDELLRTRLIDNQEGETNACSWNGVTCVDGEVHHITWIGIYTAFQPNDDVKEIDAAWSPASMRRITIRNARFRNGLRIRSLPRHCRSFHFSTCHITGEVDFRTLPLSVEGIDLSDNLLSGTLHLTGLPRSVVSINMARNRIDTVFVSNAMFRPWFKKATFEYTGPEGGRVQFKEIEDQEVDHRVKVVVFYTEYTVREYNSF